jgi:hypothetical protein
MEQVNAIASEASRLASSPAICALPAYAMTATRKEGTIEVALRAELTRATRELKECKEDLVRDEGECRGAVATPQVLRRLCPHRIPAHRCTLSPPPPPRQPLLRSV